MLTRFQIAIIGAGPGGLSAATHAAELGISHVLLEASPKIANTIQKYQVGKHVMAEPSILPLRSPLAFSAGKRETILEHWQNGVVNLNTNIQYNSAIVGIDGEAGDFRILLSNGSEIQAESIVLAIGMQGNPRKLPALGADAPFVQYTLDDPDAFTDEKIMVVGAGDAAIENAIALAQNNTVYIVNRRDEFARAKEGNLNLITTAIEDEELSCFYNSSPTEIKETPDGDSAGICLLKTASGVQEVKVDRIIARLGAIAPRGLIESFGIEFPNDDPNAIPELTAQYESNVKGLYVIGALAGYPLIKQAMNQGYEVIEYILGNCIEPADHPLLAQKLQAILGDNTVDETLSNFQNAIAVFKPLSALVFREVILESKVHAPKKGEQVFAKNDYSNSFYTIYQGNVEVVLPERNISCPQGSFFGEMGLISGRRRSATIIAGDDCVLIETPRRSIIKLLTSFPAIARVLDETFIIRSIQEKFAPNTPVEQLQSIAKQAKLNQYSANEVLFNEGDQADCLHIIRSGSITVSKQVGEKNIPVSYVPAGNIVGEMGVLGNSERAFTITATVKTETISIDAGSFKRLLDETPDLRQQIQALVEKRLVANSKIQQTGEGADILSSLMTQGVGEATDVLLINEDACINCDNCETACASTHGGTSRLNRKAGPTFAHIHLPTSCRHCEDPSCMKDCPPDAIHRGGLGGEVFIDDSCIGCGNCQRNCPYGVIQMAPPKEKNSRFWPWMFFKAGEAPGKNKAISGDVIKTAVKCDMCKDLSGGAACVRACPTGAAARVSPEQLIEVVNK